MTSNEVPTTELRRVLWACLTYWNTEPNPIDNRAVCYSWVARCYEERFGETFHPSRLQHLARLGYLTKDDTSRGGNRRYYRISDPGRLADFLNARNLN
jgi:hypothetical protein